jgi:quercetin dioxygenase-like cupin family protein
MLRNFRFAFPRGVFQQNRPLRDIRALPFTIAEADAEGTWHQCDVLASNKATGGYEVTRQEGEKGMGPPPQNHNWDESFYVIAGQVEFTCAGKTTICLPGTLVYIRRRRNRSADQPVGSPWQVT